MKRMVVFNVGGALCCYLEIGGQTILIDVGSNNGFNPIQDFLLPYFKKSEKPKAAGGDKYCFGQLLISHPHHDHISLLKDFSDHFSPQLLTCPNDKSEDGSSLNIDWDLLFPDGGIEGNPEAQLLRELYAPRQLPLTPIIKSGPDRQYLYFLRPGDVAGDTELTTGGENYANNISLVTLFTINQYQVLFPGDIMKNGLKKLLDRDNNKDEYTFRKGLQCGIDILVAAHHGLRSAFSEEMFAELPDNKVNILNIVSDKPSNADSTRETDSRYASSEYCKGENNLETSNDTGANCQRKTSQGHICINFDAGAKIDIIQDQQGLIRWFLEGC